MLSRYRHILYIPFFSLLWFLVLPFPFERGYDQVWKWFGGLHILQLGLAFEADGIQLEILQGKYAYSSHIDIILLMIASLALGLLTYATAR